MKLEAVGRDLIYEKVDPDNAKQIEDASLQEREGFGTGLDPQELPPVLQYIARNGDIWLQYVLENGQKNPTGVVEFIPLKKTLQYDLQTIDAGEYDLSISPLTIIMKNQERVFRDIRKFAEDKDIVYHHGIAMSRKGKGYGTLLLKYALDNTPYVKNSIVVCYPDAAQLDEETEELQLAPNEDSFTLHLKAGFVLAGVVDPPVYDETLTYYSFVKVEGEYARLKLNWRTIETLNLTEGASASAVLERVRQLTSMGYLGTGYDKKTHQMVFLKKEE
ncbi:hypothetical protein ES703_68191 [subsurface metagenome]